MPPSPCVWVWPSCSSSRGTCSLTASTSASSHSLTWQVKTDKPYFSCAAVCTTTAHALLTLTDIDIQMCIQDAVLVFQSTPPSAFVRHHEPTPSQPSSIPPETVSSSFFHVCTKLKSNVSLQRRGSLPLTTLKTESSLQISAHDLIVLCRLESHAIGYSGSQPSAVPPSGSLLMRGRSKERGRTRQKAVVVDIRPQEEYPSIYIHCVTAVDINNFPRYSSIIWTDYLCNGEVLVGCCVLELVNP